MAAAVAAPTDSGGGATAAGTGAERCRTSALDSAPVPKVSVVMPVYNAGTALRQAVGSVLAQTETDFELLVVDDCSSDGCTDFLAALGDPRIKVSRNAENLGAVGSRNRALSVAAGRYIAIADADDMAHPLRLEIQTGYLETHPEVDLLAGATQVFGDRGAIGPPSFPVTTFTALSLGLRYGPSFYHGSIMVCREALDAIGGYEEVPPAEDYDMYARLLLSGGRLAATTDVVLYYRDHAGGISKTKRAEGERVHRATSERVKASTRIPSVRELIRAARAEPRNAAGEPRLRYLKLLGRTAIEHVTCSPRTSVRCAVAALAVGPATWSRLPRDRSS